MLLKNQLKQLRVDCEAKGRDIEEQQRKVSRSEARITDLENQLLSVYYGHKALREESAEDKEFTRRRREEAAEQERKDAALARRIAERGSDMGSFTSTEEGTATEEPAIRTQMPTISKALPSDTTKSMTQEQKALVERIRLERKEKKDEMRAMPLDGSLAVGESKSGGHDSLPSMNKRMPCVSAFHQQACPFLILLLRMIGGSLIHSL